MSTCQVNAEESAAQPPNLPEEAMANVSLSQLQHTIPGQEEVRRQQSLREEEARLQGLRDQEREHSAATLVLEDKIAMLQGLEQEAQQTLDLASQQREEAYLAWEQTQLNVFVAQQQLEEHMAMRQESMSQRQADEEARNQETEQMARDHARAMHEMDRNQERDEESEAEETWQTEVDRAVKEAAKQRTAQQEQWAMQVAAETKAKEARVAVEAAQELARAKEAEEAAKQVARDEAVALEQREAEEAASFKPDGGEEKEEERRRQEEEDSDRAFQDLEAARREEEAKQLAVQEREEEENLEATEQASQRTQLRRTGLPTAHHLVNRSGDLFVSRPKVQSRFLETVFEVRLWLCRNANLGPHDVLPISLQKLGQRRLFEDWAASKAGQKKQQEVILHEQFKTPFTQSLP